MSAELCRAEFEKWVQTTSAWRACKQRNKPMYLRQSMDGSYNDFRVNDRWFAYKAAWNTRANDVDIESLRQLVIKWESRAAEERRYSGEYYSGRSQAYDACSEELADKLTAALPESKP